MAPQIPMPVTYFAPCFTKQPPGALFIHFVIPHEPHIITFFLVDLYFAVKIKDKSIKMAINQKVKTVNISCSFVARTIERDKTSMRKNEKNYSFTEFNRYCVGVSTPRIR